MSAPLVAACLWVLAGVGVAMLPLRRQFLPGGILLLGAPALLIWIGAVHGIWAGLAAMLAVLSMFRRPLRELLRRVLRRESGGDRAQ